MRILMKYFLGLLFLAFIIFSFFSCQKHVESKIEGNWREVNVINPDTTELIDWNFSGGHFYVIRSFTDSVKIDTQAYGEYVIKIKPFKKIFSVTSCSDKRYIADWEITQLTKRFLNIAVRRNILPVTYYEFYRL
jgi:hypothetical protein